MAPRLRLGRRRGSVKSLVSGAAVNVWPSGTRGAPVKVGPCAPGVRGLRFTRYFGSRPPALRSSQPRWPVSQSARPSGVIAAA